MIFSIHQPAIYCSNPSFLLLNTASFVLRKVAPRRHRWHTWCRWKWRSQKTRGDHRPSVLSGDKKWGKWDLNLESHILEIFTYLYISGDEQRHGDSIYIWLSEKCGHLSSESTHFCGTQLVNPGWINPDYLAKTPTKMPTESVVSWVTRPGKLTVANLKMAIEIEDEYPWIAWWIFPVRSVAVYQAG